MGYRLDCPRCTFGCSQQSDWVDHLFSDDHRAGQSVVDLWNWCPEKDERSVVLAGDEKSDWKNLALRLSSWCTHNSYFLDFQIDNRFHLAVLLCVNVDTARYFRKEIKRLHKALDPKFFPRTSHKLNYFLADDKYYNLTKFLLTMKPEPSEPEEKLEKAKAKDCQQEDPYSSLIHLQQVIQSLRSLPMNIEQQFLYLIERFAVTMPDIKVHREIYIKLSEALEKLVNKSMPNDIFSKLSMMDGEGNHFGYKYWPLKVELVVSSKDGDKDEQSKPKDTNYHAQVNALRLISNLEDSSPSFKIQSINMTPNSTPKLTLLHELNQDVRIDLEILLPEDFQQRSFSMKEISFLFCFDPRAHHLANFLLLWNTHREINLPTETLMHLVAVFLIKEKTIPSIKLLQDLQTHKQGLNSLNWDYSFCSEEDVINKVFKTTSKAERYKKFKQRKQILILAARFFYLYSKNKVENNVVSLIAGELIPRKYFLHSWESNLPEVLRVKYLRKKDGKLRDFGDKLELQNALIVQHPFELGRNQAQGDKNWKGEGVGMEMVKMFGRMCEEDYGRMKRVLQREDLRCFFDTGLESQEHDSDFGGGAADNALKTKPRYSPTVGQSDEAFAAHLRQELSGLKVFPRGKIAPNSNLSPFVIDISSSSEEEEEQGQKKEEELCPSSTPTVIVPSLESLALAKQNPVPLSEISFTPTFPEVGAEVEVGVDRDDEDDIEITAVVPLRHSSWVALRKRAKERKEKKANSFSSSSPSPPLPPPLPTEEPSSLPPPPSPVPEPVPTSEISLSSLPPPLPHEELEENESTESTENETETLAQNLTHGDGDTPPTTPSSPCEVGSNDSTTINSAVEVEVEKQSADLLDQPEPVKPPETIPEVECTKDKFSPGPDNQIPTPADTPTTSIDTPEVPEDELHELPFEIVQEPIPALPPLQPVEKLIGFKFPEKFVFRFCTGIQSGLNYVVTPQELTMKAQHLWLSFLRDFVDQVWSKSFGIEVIPTLENQNCQNPNNFKRKYQNQTTPDDLELENQPSTSKQSKLNPDSENPTEFSLRVRNDAYLQANAAPMWFNKFLDLPDMVKVDSNARYKSFYSNGYMLKLTKAFWHRRKKVSKILDNVSTLSTKEGPEISDLNKDILKKELQITLKCHELMESAILKDVVMTLDSSEGDSGTKSDNILDTLLDKNLPMMICKIDANLGREKNVFLLHLYVPSRPCSPSSLVINSLDIEVEDAMTELELILPGMANQYVMEKLEWWLLMG